MAAALVEQQAPLAEMEEPPTVSTSPIIRINNRPATTDSFVSIPITGATSHEQFLDAINTSDSSTPSNQTIEVPAADDYELSTPRASRKGFRQTMYNPETRDFPEYGVEDGEYDEADLAKTPVLSRSHSRSRSRSDSSSSHKSEGSGDVDWAGLEKTEEQETRDVITDQSTAFLLARLEQENNALATDPRFGMHGRTRKESRPPSMHVLKRLVKDPETKAMRYSISLPTPPMTELDFWAALVKDYRQTTQRLPTLTSNKIKNGVPPPLRGVVWVSMVGARDTELGAQFDRLCLETSPYESLIGKDIGRSFPGVDMFRDPMGEGQQMLGRVLRCFSLYDKDIGYCQGLGFIVGPLLMQMGDKDAFCVLVKLMENYDLRSCFLPNLSGLHVRIYTFQRLLDQHMPTLAAHLRSLQVEAAYLSQWFLSLFAVTCPLPMLFRIYDVLLGEGVSETVMRVAMSLMRRNEDKIMKSKEFEEVMHLLLSRDLWEAYNYDGDELVHDFMDLSGLVSHDSLRAMEASFKAQHGTDPGNWYAFLPDATAAASRFLGRLWNAAPPSRSGLAPGQPSHSRQGSFLRRSPSKQSIATSFTSTDISSEGTNSLNSVATAATDASQMSRESADLAAHKAELLTPQTPLTPGLSKEDRDMHSQIEGLLTALSATQRQHADLAAALQAEREERAEDHAAFEALVQRVRGSAVSQKDAADADAAPFGEGDDVLELASHRLVLHSAARNKRSSLASESKQRLRDSLLRSKSQLEVESSRATQLARLLDEQEKETAHVRETLRFAQSRLQDEMRKRDELEKALQGRTSRPDSFSWDADRPLARRQETDTSRSSMASKRLSMSSSGAAGLRELRLARQGSAEAGSPGSLAPSGGLPKRSTSLAAPPEDASPTAEDDLLAELVAAKTAEALARGELDELKNKFDALRKMLGIPSPPPASPPGIVTNLAAALAHRPAGSESGSVPTDKSPVRSTPVPATPGPATPGGFASLWAWGKRSASTGAAGAAPPALGVAGAGAGI